MDWERALSKISYYAWYQSLKLIVILLRRQT